jgi:hypothetical protein
MAPNIQIIANGERALPAVGEDFSSTVGCDPFGCFMAAQKLMVTEPTS